ncbi:putative extracellular dihydrogeodin oxidase/laccase [Mollisia scopiformis]|uniref:laccase n=1 Tax=Mollisia scopiformis TaxID=149040 RepID=A0A194XM36_MOLSC|nr:putative extracellular dihydrogeodin oxidase/laccase [Mollisia scopiformis]KUJ20827.1 putative extracellular dihydrogeodin oxidase/laccase [Mollisia scopiformis]
MRFRNVLVSLALASTTLAAPKALPQSVHSVSKRCTNSATYRACWGDYDLSTNYYDVVPDTGVIREYWFSIENITCAPDGVSRVCLAVNGTIPGPTIIAGWGDTIVIHATNNMENNGSSINFHGIRQNYTNLMDGVPSVTQCPIAPGTTYTYTWRATQYGSSWYHSHFYVQAWDGIFGGIHINGPATANYDVDAGTLTLGDWSHLTADVEMVSAIQNGPPTLSNGLINGTNTWNESDGTVIGSRFEMDVVAGQSYRLRIINVAADSQIKFSIDNHTLEVISTDFVPIVPYSTDVVSISIGQRYDVVFTANATADNYWLRAVIQTACSDNEYPDNVLGIIRYDADSTDDPTSSGTDAAVTNGLTCEDEDASLLVPYLAIVASDEPDYSDDFAVQLVEASVGGLWEMGNSSFFNYWDYPTVLQAYEGNDTWTDGQQVYAFPDADRWVYFIIQTTNAQPHPLHLHGHDFWVIGQGTGTYDSATANLTLVNTPRRDVALLPGDGYLVIAFYTDNPGAWLMHCHIAWHTTEGLAIQLLEREADFVPLIDDTILNSTCASWDAYTPESVDDSVQASPVYDNGI